MSDKENFGLSDYSNLIGLVYEAAQNPELWPELLIELEPYLANQNHWDDINRHDPQRESSLLEPHLLRAIKINENILTLETKAKTSEQILNRIPIGIIITNSKSQPIALNSRAQKVLNGHRCLYINDGRICTNSLKQTEQLHQLIQTYTSGIHLKSGRSMAVHTNDEQDNITSIWVTSTTNPTNADEYGFAAIYVASPLIQPTFHVEAIQQSFGLTQAEAKLVKTLTNGCHNMNDATQRLGISVHTGRTQLKAIFGKTNTNSQLELIKKVLTSPSVIFGEPQPPEKFIPETIFSQHNVPFLSVHLFDGRRLSYAEYGDPQGSPVFLFHGIVGSRLQFPADDKEATSLGLRFIVPDRPGIGYSDIKHDYTLLDWPKDVVQLADHLGLHKFSIMGFAAGSAYAMACAFSIPERLEKVSLVMARGPLDTVSDLLSIDGIILTMAQHTPAILKKYLHIMVSDIKQDPVKRLEKRHKNLCLEDKICIQSNPAQQAMYNAAFIESARQGSIGIAQDLITVTQPWGFSPHQIHHPIRLWHGVLDKGMPIRAAKKLAQALPNCEATFVEDIGAMLIIHKWKEILGDIAKDLPKQD